MVMYCCEFEEYLAKHGRPPPLGEWFCNLSYNQQVELNNGLEKYKNKLERAARDELGTPASKKRKGPTAVDRPSQPPPSDPQPTQSGPPYRYDGVDVTNPEIGPVTRFTPSGPDMWYDKQKDSFRSGYNLNRILYPPQASEGAPVASGSKEEIAAPKLAPAGVRKRAHDERLKAAEDRQKAAQEIEVRAEILA